MTPLVIAHRANLEGPDPKIENTLGAIQECVDVGMDMELDVWYKDCKYYLGHDEPKTEFDLENFNFQGSSVFFHAKDLETLNQLLTLKLEIYNHDCFVHDKDMATLTYKNRIWTYPGRDLHKLSIAVMPEYQCKTYREDVERLFLQKKIKGICTDFPYDWMNLKLEE